MAHRHDHHLVDEEADDDRGALSRMSLTKRTRRERAAAAVFGEEGAGQDADRRADERGDRGHHHAAVDGVASGRRCCPAAA